MMPAPPTFFLLPNGITVDVGTPPEGATLVDARGESPFSQRKLTSMALASVLALHAERHDGGVRANLGGADLRGADLRGARHIVSAGPVGLERRIIYGVHHDSGTMIQAGCSWATADETIAKIEDRYADGNGREKYRESYLAAVRWVVSALAVSP